MEKRGSGGTEDWGWSGLEASTEDIAAPSHPKQLSPGSQLSPSYLITEVPMDDPRSSSNAHTVVLDNVNTIKDHSHRQPYCNSGINVLPSSRNTKKILPGAFSHHIPPLLSSRQQVHLLVVCLSTSPPSLLRQRGAALFLILVIRKNLDVSIQWTRHPPAEGHALRRCQSWFDVPGSLWQEADVFQLSSFPASDVRGVCVSSKVCCPLDYVVYRQQAGSATDQCCCLQQRLLGTK